MKHTKFGWALGTFGFILAAVFLIRMYAVYQHRLKEDRITIQVERAGLLLQRTLEGQMRDIETWAFRDLAKGGVLLSNADRSALNVSEKSSKPPIWGVRAVRFYQMNGMVAQWNDESVRNVRFGLEPMLMREAETRLMQLNEKLVGLSWVSRSQTKVLLAMDKAGFLELTSDDPEISLVLVNSSEQVLATSRATLDFEVFRPDFQYKYDGRGQVETASLEKEILGYYSVPGFKGLVLIGRYKR